MTELCAVEVTARNGVAVARLSGEIDASNADATFAAVEKALSEQPQGLILDLSGLDYLDSAGVRLLFKLSHNAPADSILRAVVPPAAPIRRVLELANVVHSLPLADSADAALEGMRSDLGSDLPV